MSIADRHFRTDDDVARHEPFAFGERLQVAEQMRLSRAERRRDENWLRALPLRDPVH